MCSRIFPLSKGNQSRLGPTSRLGSVQSCGQTDTLKFRRGRCACRASVTTDALARLLVACADCWTVLFGLTPKSPVPHSKISIILSKMVKMTKNLICWIIMTSTTQWRKHKCVAYFPDFQEHNRTCPVLWNKM